ncbi:MAG: alpha/beta hydrolase, partial [Planctomycetaceae bacterium]
MACRFVDSTAGRPELVVVLCHGYGAAGDDLAPLAGEIVRQFPLRGVRFVFPEAPLLLGRMGLYESRAWWELDVERLIQAAESGRFCEVRRGNPTGLAEAGELLRDVVTALGTEVELPLDRFILGGFSQGAMLATDVSLRLPEPPGGLAIFSGTLVCEDLWADLARARGPLRVLQSHGQRDPILPFEGAVALRDLLTAAGLDVDFIPFDGVHTISAAAVQRFATMIET